MMLAHEYMHLRIEQRKKREIGIGDGLIATRELKLSRYRMPISLRNVRTSSIIWPVAHSRKTKSYLSEAQPSATLMKACRLK